MARKRYKINYVEGDCIAVPLNCGGYARGVVARMDKKGTILGYFFGPKFTKLEDVVVTPDLTATNCIFVKFFGDLGLVTNRWSVVGKITPWIREDWPIPIYGFVEPLFKKWGELRFISEKKLNGYSCIKRVTVEEAVKYPDDGLAGSEFVELRLARLLREGNVPPPVNIVPVPEEYS